MSVRKLDTALFDVIPSQLKTEQELFDTASKVIRNNYNLFKKQLNIDSNGELYWVSENINNIIKLTKEDKEATKRIKLEALANLLLYINKHHFKEVARKLFLKGKEIQGEIDEVKGDQEYTEREEEAKITYEELVALRKQYKDKESYKDKMIYLILAINTYCPPLRLDFIETETEAIVFGCNEVNYITDRPDGNDTMTLTITKDKVSDKVGADELIYRNYVTKKGYPFIFGNKLKKVIRQSKTETPRKYVITSTYDFNKYMTVSSYNRLLKEVTGKPVTQNAIRKAYINYWYKEEHGLTFNNKKTISRFMRNSPTVSDVIYKKIE